MKKGVGMSECGCIVTALPDPNGPDQFGQRWTARILHDGRHSREADLAMEELVAAAQEFSNRGLPDQRLLVALDAARSWILHGDVRT
jgi:hypothetical protein